MLLIYYNLVIAAALSLGAPYLLFQMLFHRRYREGLGERLGLYRGRSLDAGRPSICVQTASVGEVSAALPLLRLISEQLPGYRLVITCQTAAGRKLAREKLVGRADVVMGPVDLLFLARRFIRAFAPAILILVETELWPSMISEVRRKKIPVIVVSGRISAWSFNYYRQVKSLLKPLLQNIDLFNMRTERDARRLLSLGAPRDRVFVQGNIKFDSFPLPGPLPAFLERFRQAAGWSEDDKVIVAGSTYRGEEALLADALQVLRSEHPGLKLILTPRHLERVKEVEGYLRSRGTAYCLFSDPKSGSGDVVVVDRIGLLSDIYRLATVVFVGRSLKGGGGQNPIEPAGLAKPLVFGPLMDNFREISDELTRAGGAIEVRDQVSLQAALGRFLGNPAEAEKAGRAAGEVVMKQRGASQRNLDEIKRLLERSEK